MINKTFLHQALQKNHYNLSDEIENQFIAYLNLLEQWNRVFNLTAIRDPKAMVMLHILDSLSVHAFLHGQRIIDVGTGAGLPGIPLALFYPQKEFVLLDSNSKKTRFLNQVVIDLKLKNVTVIHARCEAFHPEKKFDSVISRAFSSIESMLQATHHLVEKNGVFLAMKGVYPTEEIAKISNHFIVQAVEKLQIESLTAERHIVCIKEREWEK